MWKFFFFDIPSDILKNYHFKVEVKVISYANLRKTMDVWIYFIYKKTVKKKGRYGHGSFTFQYLLIVLQTTCHPLGEQVYGYIINKIEYSKRNRIDFSEERNGKIHGKIY